jgi:hypothetical protein
MGECLRSINRSVSMTVESANDFSGKNSNTLELANSLMDKEGRQLKFKVV